MGGRFDDFFEDSPLLLLLFHFLWDPFRNFLAGASIRIAINKAKKKTKEGKSSSGSSRPNTQIYIRAKQQNNRSEINDSIVNHSPISINQFRLENVTKSNLQLTNVIISQSVSRPSQYFHSWIDIHSDWLHFMNLIE